ncbi:hypothetical protein AB9K17_23855, partial [Salmonella enterica subsp. enterica serovar Kentucky]|uniref:hypothetical protein n=1 Tax=Salmonella enterica TaxID=28901 RepID=UPI003F4B5F9B
DYRVSNANGSASVSVLDNDTVAAGVPVVSVEPASGSLAGITEGGTAEFIISSDITPATPITVHYAVE